MKKIIALVLALAAICTMSFAQVSAGNETTVNGGLPADYVPGYGADSDADVPGMKSNFQTPVEQMTKAEQVANGLRSPRDFATTRGTFDGRLCIITGGRWDVYSSATGTTEIGFVDSRERVYVYNYGTSTSRSYIQFSNYGTLTNGYVASEAILAPSYNFASPIITGSVSKKYMAGGHHGIDVEASAGTTVYAIKSGEYIPVVWTATIEGEKTLVNYGNLIQTFFYDNSNVQVQVIYGHLSAFKYGIAYSGPSYRTYYEGVGNWAKQSGTTVAMGGGVGSVGNTGYSSGNHLHFETRQSGNTSNQFDPYTYVIFPGVGY